MSINSSSHSTNYYEHSWPNQSFFHWLRTQTSLYIGQIIALLAFPSTLIALIYYSTHSPGIEHITPHDLQALLILLHIPFLLLFLIKFSLILDKNDIGAYRSNMVYKRVFKERKNTPELRECLLNCQHLVKTFKKYFVAFIVSLLFLYIVFAINSHHSTKHYLKRNAAVLGYTHLKVIGQDTIPFPFKQILSVETDPTEDFPKKEITVVKTKDSFFSTSDNTEALYHVLPAFWAFTLNNISFLFIFMCFTLLYLPPFDENNKRKQRILIRNSIIFICALTLAFPILIMIGVTSNYTHLYLVGYVTFFNAISGVLNAVALALLIGRLDSKLIGLPSNLVSVLYVYAAVQPLFVVFELPMFVNDVIKTAVFAIVFIFKIYFFFIIVYAFQTGRLLNYFFCFPELNKLVDSIFRNQFEITINKEHSHKFIFQINKGDSSIFTSDLIFDKRRECLHSIKHLRKVMKRIDSFKIKKSDGTYWLEVRDENDIVYCNSQNLKTREEAEELRVKAHEKLPFCKLNYT